MLTRIIKTDIFVDHDMLQLTPDVRNICVYLYCNSHIGLTNLYKLSPRVAELETGYDMSVIKLALDQLQRVGIIKHRDHSWIMLLREDFASLTYSGEKNEKAKAKYLESIPSEVKSHFFSDTSIDTTIDTSMHTSDKSGIRNHKSEINTEDDTPKVEKLDTDPLFEEWWAIFPASKRMSKQECKKKYVKDLTLEEHRRRVQHLLDQKERDRKWIGGFIPNVTTYINQKRWDTEVEVETRTSSSTVLA